MNTLDAVGDYIHSEDVADAILSLLRAPRLRYSAYNVAAGEAATVGDLIRWIAEKVPGFRAEVTATRGGRHPAGSDTQRRHVGRL